MWTRLRRRNKLCLKPSPRCFTGLHFLFSPSPSPHSSSRSLLSFVCGVCWSQALHLISLLRSGARDRPGSFGGNMTLSADQKLLDCDRSPCAVHFLQPWLSTPVLRQLVYLLPLLLLFRSPSLSLSCQPPPKLVHCCSPCLPLPPARWPVCRTHSLFFPFCLSRSPGC